MAGGSCGALPRGCMAAMASGLAAVVCHTAVDECAHCQQCAKQCVSTAGGGGSAACDVSWVVQTWGNKFAGVGFDDLPSLAGSPMVGPTTAMVRLRAETSVAVTADTWDG